MRYAITHFIAALQGLGFGDKDADICGEATVDEIDGWLDYLSRAAEFERTALVALQTIAAYADARNVDEMRSIARAAIVKAG